MQQDSQAAAVDEEARGVRGRAQAGVCRHFVLSDSDLPRSGLGEDGGDSTRAHGICSTWPFQGTGRSGASEDLVSLEGHWRELCWQGDGPPADSARVRERWLSQSTAAAVLLLPGSEPTAPAGLCLCKARA